MIKLSMITVSLIISLFSFSATGQTKTEEEVQHLLQYISNSGCIFIRNDIEYPAKEAAQHIQRKYNHMKDRTKTADQVIKYAASESSFSGKPYMIKCSGKEPIKSAEWLTEELMKYRSLYTTQN